MAQICILTGPRFIKNQQQQPYERLGHHKFCPCFLSVGVFAGGGAAALAIAAFLLWNGLRGG